MLAVIALAEELRFTRAADRLHISQSTLSKQITDLEEEQRFHLFTEQKLHTSDVEEYKSN